MNVLGEIWFWLLVIGSILIFIAILLWGIRGKADWWTWILIIIGNIAITIAIIIVDRGQFFF